MSKVKFYFFFAYFVKILFHFFFSLGSKFHIGALQSEFPCPNISFLQYPQKLCLIVIEPKRTNGCYTLNPFKFASSFLSEEQKKNPNDHKLSPATIESIKLEINGMDVDGLKCRWPKRDLHKFDFLRFFLMQNQYMSNDCLDMNFAQFCNERFICKL